ncbi:MAG: GNAT family N-acetyltransferase [Pseudomonadota bacterium]
MTYQEQTYIRKAEPEDARDLAQLIDIAGEGIPSWLWAQSSTSEKTPLDVGAERARREEGGFSYRNALLAVSGVRPLGMVLSYPIEKMSTEDPKDLPKPIVPFVELETLSVGTWYVNALAVFAGVRSNGVGSRLLKAAENLAIEAAYKSMSIQVYSQNTGAVQLYERLGFKETARSKVRDHPCQPYYNEDVLLLIKNLRG